MTVEARSWTMPSLGSGYLDGESPFIYGVALWLALIQVSIAASQIVLALLVTVWLLRVFRGEMRLRSLPFDRPFALYAATSLTAAVLSFDPGSSLAASKKLLLLVVPYLIVSTSIRRETLERLVLVLIAIADLGAIVGLWQYHFGELGDINHRIRGFMSHYMTYSGLLMGVSVLAVALLLFRGRHRWFLAGSLLVMQTALALTLTRSAWLGTAAAVLVLVLLRDRRLLLVAPALAVLVGLLLPADVENRLASFLRPDASGVDRLYMLRAGAGMVQNHPWLGVGPGMVADVYPIYVESGAPHHENVHLHNNLMQIAAERGLLCLAAWLWFVVVALRRAIEAFRASANAAARSLNAGALGVLTAGIVAGIFEYNFGDSEFQMLFLFAMAIPLTLRGDEVESS